MSTHTFPFPMYLSSQPCMHPLSYPSATVFTFCFFYSSFSSLCSCQSVLSFPLIPSHTACNYSSMTLHKKLTDFQLHLSTSPSFTLDQSLSDALLDLYTCFSTSSTSSCLFVLLLYCSLFPCKSSIYFFSEFSFEPACVRVCGLWAGYQPEARNVITSAHIYTSFFFFFLSHIQDIAMMRVLAAVCLRGLEGVLNTLIEAVGSTTGGTAFIHNGGLVAGQTKRENQTVALRFTHI